MSSGTETLSLNVTRQRCRRCTYGHVWLTRDTQHQESKNEIYVAVVPAFYVTVGNEDIAKLSMYSVDLDQSQ
jgi:hypothetical protein